MIMQVNMLNGMNSYCRRVQTWPFCLVSKVRAFLPHQLALHSANLRTRNSQHCAAKDINNVVVDVANVVVAARVASGGRNANRPLDLSHLLAPAERIIYFAPLDCAKSRRRLTTRTT